MHKIVHPSFPNFFAPLQKGKNVQADPERPLEKGFGRLQANRTIAKNVFVQFREMTFMLLTIFFNGGIFQSVISSNKGTVFINAN